MIIFDVKWIVNKIRPRQYFSMQITFSFPELQGLHAKMSQQKNYKQRLAVLFSLLPTARKAGKCISLTGIDKQNYSEFERNKL
jgi:hypothetical protein